MCKQNRIRFGSMSTEQLGRGVHSLAINEAVNHQPPTRGSADRYALAIAWAEDDKRESIEGQLWERTHPISVAGRYRLLLAICRGNVSSRQSRSACTRSNCSV